MSMISALMTMRLPMMPMMPVMAVVMFAVLVVFGSFRLRHWHSWIPLLRRVQGSRIGARAERCHGVYHSSVKIV